MNRGNRGCVGVSPRISMQHLITQLTPQDPYFLPIILGSTDSVFGHLTHNRHLSESNSSPLPDFRHQVSILPLAATVTAVACSAAFPTIGSKMTPMKAPAALLGLFEEGLCFDLLWEGELSAISRTRIVGTDCVTVLTPGQNQKINISPIEGPSPSKLMLTHVDPLSTYDSLSLSLCGTGTHVWMWDKTTKE